MKKIRPFLIVLVFMGLSACKQERKNTSSAIKIEGEFSQQEVFESNPEMDLVEIDLYSNDKMKYNLGEINVYEGQRIRLTFHHVGELPTTVMGHNFVLKDNTMTLA